MCLCLNHQWLGKLGQANWVWNLIYLHVQSNALTVRTATDQIDGTVLYCVIACQKRVHRHVICKPLEKEMGNTKILAEILFCSEWCALALYMMYDAVGWRQVMANKSSTRD